MSLLVYLIYTIFLQRVPHICLMHKRKRRAIEM